MAAASIGLVAVAAFAFAPRSSEAPRSVLVLRSAEPASPWVYSAPTAAPIPTTATLPLLPALALPVGTAARLSAIPDALLNDPPAARFRVPIEVRGRTGLASIDLPTVIVWSEAGYWYELSSARLTVPQLIDLASALE